jgi:hypothetical protein
MIKICPQCNQEFETRHIKQSHCGRKCAGRTHSELMMGARRGMFYSRGDKTRDTVYRFLVDYKQRNDGNSPTLRDIMAACDMSCTSLASRTVSSLVRQGRIRRGGRGKSGGIVIVGAQWIPPTANESNG